MGFCKAPISELVTTGFRHLLEMPAYRYRSTNEAVGSLVTRRVGSRATDF
jgi:hypothetical protein